MPLEIKTVPKQINNGIFKFIGKNSQTLSNHAPNTFFTLTLQCISATILGASFTFFKNATVAKEIAKQKMNRKKKKGPGHCALGPMQKPAQPAAPAPPFLGFLPPPRGSARNAAAPRRTPPRAARQRAHRTPPGRLRPPRTPPGVP